MKAPAKAESAGPQVELLCGYRAIAEHLGIGTRELAALDQQRLVPTYRQAGVICASRPALDHYLETKGAADGERR